MIVDRKSKIVNTYVHIVKNDPIKTAIKQSRVQKQSAIITVHSAFTPLLISSHTHFKSRRQTKKITFKNTHLFNGSFYAHFAVLIL